MSKAAVCCLIVVGLLGVVAGVLSSSPEVSAPTFKDVTSNLSPRTAFDFGQPVPGAIQPIPERPDLDPARRELGRRLFHETRFSSDGAVSCASCHDLSKGGDDGRQTSVGAHGVELDLNAPTVFNAVFNFRQGWAGGDRDLGERVEGALHNDMGATWDDVLAFLQKDAQYKSAFASAYEGVIDQTTVVDAFVTFGYSLTTPNAPFDRYLRGDTSALTARQVEGYELFLDLGCVTCHQGVNIGGNMFQKLGNMNPFETHDPEASQHEGRFAITGRNVDRLRFKVPTLRNIARTAPYLHDGSSPDLASTVRTMAYHELGIDIADEQVEKIVSFLESLDGEYESR